MRSGGPGCRIPIAWSISPAVATFAPADPARLADRIHQLLAVPPGERPRVVFYSAAARSNDVTGLVDALAPLEAEGVRFVSASAGLKCVREGAR